VPAGLDALAWGAADAVELGNLLEKLRFGPLTRSRCLKLRAV